MVGSSNNLEDFVSQQGELSCYESKTSSLWLERRVSAGRALHGMWLDPFDTCKSVAGARSRSWTCHAFPARHDAASGQTITKPGITSEDYMGLSLMYNAANSKIRR